MAIWNRGSYVSFASIYWETSSTGHFADAAELLPKVQELAAPAWSSARMASFLYRAQHDPELKFEPLRGVGKVVR